VPKPSRPSRPVVLISAAISHVVAVLRGRVDRVSAEISASHATPAVHVSHVSAETFDDAVM